MKEYDSTSAVIYPDKQSGYKDNKGNPINKWFIRYKIQLGDGTNDYRKEYGGSYNINLNRIKDIKVKREKAELLLKLVQHDLKRGIDPENRELELEKVLMREMAESEQYNFENVFSRWFAQKNYVNPIPSKVNSARNINMFHRNQFIPYLKELKKLDDIRKITDEDINQFISENYEKGNWSMNTANVRIAWISGVFVYAFKKAKLIKENPMVLVSKIKEDKVIVREGKQVVKIKTDVRFQAFTDNELEAIYRNWKGSPYEVICKTIYFSFVRFSEMFRFKLRNLDLEGGKWIIPSNIAKGQRDGATKYVTIYTELKQLLTEYLDNYFGDDRNPDYYLFYGKTKSVSMGYTLFNYHWLKLMKKLKKEGINITKKSYALKHTGAKRFINHHRNNNQMSSMQIITELKNQMRHADFATTQLYIFNELGINLEDTTDYSFT
ncbi:MAG: site-specific integrase [Pedobacter sp.]|nr:MAG: site-specific integrase [Pedobacter sp.]